MFYGFYGGVHPESLKTLTLDKPTKRVFIPGKVVIPLLQHTGSPAQPVVSVGDSVEVGSLIAKATGFISSNIHASINGKVTKISYHPTPVLPRVLSITIESQGGDQDFKAVKRSSLDAATGAELLEMIREAGVVGMGGAAFPTHVKLSPPKEKTIDTIIINGAECEPYLTCDHRIMLEKPKEILKGLEIFARILGVKSTYIAIEDNKLSAIYTMEKAVDNLKFSVPGIKCKVVVLKTKYPQGAEKQIIKSILDRIVPAGGLPMDVGCLVQNVGTTVAAYEAVYSGKPLIERIITISGDSVKEPVNIAVRIGTLISDLKELCGGFSKEPKKMIVGGPMMGISQYTDGIPVIKGTSGILFFSGTKSDLRKESVCIRCGKCVEVCPVELAPTTLMNRVKKSHFKEAKELGIINCFECGSCAYICPAAIPLLDYMKYGKSKCMQK